MPLDKLLSKANTGKQPGFRLKSLLLLSLALVLLLSACAQGAVVEPEAGETASPEEVTEPPVATDPPVDETEEPAGAVTQPPTDMPVERPTRELELVPTQTPPEGGGSADPDHPAAQAAIEALMRDNLSLAATQISVVSITPEQFTDGCLGLGGPDELCLQAITPGYVVVLSVDGQEYTFHTDETGSIVRQRSTFTPRALRTKTP